MAEKREQEQPQEQPDSVQDAGRGSSTPSHSPAKKRARLDDADQPQEQDPSATTQQPQLDPESLAYRLAQYSSHSDSRAGEALVGISDYVNPSLPPFKSAIIKHRFTDFIVWEIERESHGGKVVRLKDISRPVPAVLEDKEKEEDTPKEEEEKPEEQDLKLEDYMTELKVQELKTFVEQGSSGSGKGKQGENPGGAVNGGMKPEMFTDVCTFPISPSYSKAAMPIRLSFPLKFSLLTLGCDRFFALPSRSPPLSTPLPPLLVL